MASEARGIELADVSDLAALVDEVRRSRHPRILRQNGEDVALLMPVVRPERQRSHVSHPRPPTEAEITRSRAGIMAAAGSWQDVDVEALKRDFHRQRDVTTRPPVEL